MKSAFKVGEMVYTVHTCNIGKGKIPLSIFKLIMNDKRLVNIPKILETPIQTGKEYVDEIKLLKKMVRS